HTRTVAVFRAWNAGKRAHVTLGGRRGCALGVARAPFAAPGHFVTHRRAVVARGTLGVGGAARAALVAAERRVAILAPVRAHAVAGTVGGVRCINADGVCCRAADVRVQARGGDAWHTGHTGVVDTHAVATICVLQTR